MIAAIDWVPVKNTTDEPVPAGGLMRVIDIVDGVAQIEKPNQDGDGAVIVNSLVAIPGGGDGQGHLGPRAIIAFDPVDGDPETGELWGSSSGSWLAAKNQDGFKILGGASRGLVNASRYRSLAESEAASNSSTSGTYAVSCEGLTSGEVSETYTVVYTCPQIALLPSGTICFYYMPTADLAGDACDEPTGSFTLICGADAVRFLATAEIDSINYCGGDCGDVVGEIPTAGECVRLYDGTRAYASLAVGVYLQSSFDGYGFPISYTTPNGKVSVSGKMVFCTTRTTPGWYFAGTIRSTDSDPSNPDKFDCGCDTVLAACSDANGVTQSITAGPSFSGGGPTETLLITTPCGTLKIGLMGPWPCASPPPPVTYNCIAGRCVDPRDGTGTFTSLGACLASPCNPTIPVTYNCVSNRCRDPLDGTGTFGSLIDCEDSPCAAPVTYNCTIDACTDPGDGTGTYTSAFGSTFTKTTCAVECVCCKSYLTGKTGAYSVSGLQWSPDGAGPPVTGSVAWATVASASPGWPDYLRARWSVTTGGGGTFYYEATCGNGFAADADRWLLAVWKEPHIPDWAGGSDPADYSGQPAVPAQGPGSSATCGAPSGPAVFDWILSGGAGGGEVIITT